MLDGFPRTVGQAKALDAIMDERGQGPLVVVDVVVPEQELVRRLGSRRICSTCGDQRRARRDGACTKCGGELVVRADDDAQVVLERLKVYEQRHAAGARVLPGAAARSGWSTGRRRRSRWRTTWTR